LNMKYLLELKVRNESFGLLILFVISHCSVCLSVNDKYLSLSVSLCLSLSLCLSVCVCLSLSLCLSLSPFLCSTFGGIYFARDQQYPSPTRSMWTQENVCTCDVKSCDHCYPNCVDTNTNSVCKNCMVSDPQDQDRAPHHSSDIGGLAKEQETQENCYFAFRVSTVLVPTKLKPDKRLAAGDYYVTVRPTNPQGKFTIRAEYSASGSARCQKQ